MAGNPQVTELLEEMLEAGRTPEEVCRDCPELLAHVRQRWQAFCRVDAAVRAWLSQAGTIPDAGPIVAESADAGLPQIAGYEVEALLGRGGMGVVYKARHVALKRTVAVKMLGAAHASASERARFKTEAEAVARLQHPNIVQIHEIGETEGRPFFAMEFVAGGSLATRLAGRTLPPRDAAGLVSALAEAMHLAHCRNLVHRDLKPGNVLLSGAADTPIIACQPKVTDFGLARQLDADSGQTQVGTVLGTPSYMAPEQAEGLAHAAGPAADIYALGAILYECLTGRPPFAGATPLQTLEQVRSREPAAPSCWNRQVPRDLETICLKCLRKEPEQRYFSARELADDLGRFVRGEPVAARPVGRPERVVKWMRRNPTVACLSAVAALALVTGTIVSLLFGVEARRKADALEQQAIQLHVQTRAAQQNARRAVESEKQATRALVSGLLIPIGRNPHLLSETLDAAEGDAMRQLRAAPAPVRLQFLETALRDPAMARRVGRRADWVVQAIVGCDRALRADVARLAVQRILEPGSQQEVRFACARIGLALNLADRAWAEHAADALLVVLREPLVERTDMMVAQNDYPPLAAALVAVCDHLPANRAADYAARALDVLLSRLREPEGQSFAGHHPILRAVMVLGPCLDVATAARAADTLCTAVRAPGSDQNRWPTLCMALAAVCRRLPASDGAAHVNRMVDFIIETQGATQEKDKGKYAVHAQALGALGGGLDAANASRAANAIIAILGEVRTSGDGKFAFISLGYIAAALTKAAERLDSPGSLEAAEKLVLVLRKAENIPRAREELTAALVAVCKCLDGPGAARVADAMAAATRDPKASVLARTLFADGYAAFAGRLTPDQAAALESALVDALLADLAEAKSADVREFLAPALAKASGRPGAKGAARAAKGLAAAIHDPQTPLAALRPLAAALAAVSGQLAPKDAAVHAKEAIDVLDALWVAKTAPLERASVAEALAAVLTILDRSDTVDHARSAAAELEDALRSCKDRPTELYRLAEALSQVYYHVGSAERSKRANAVADVLVTALLKPRDDPWTITHLSQALAGLFAHLDNASTIHVADAAFTVLGGPNVQQFKFELHEKLFKSVAAHLDDANVRRLLDHPLAAGRLQRVLLDSLAASKHRSIRNTWDYLDGAETSAP